FTGVLCGLAFTGYVYSIYKMSVYSMGRHHFKDLITFSVSLSNMSVKHGSSSSTELNPKYADDKGVKQHTADAYGFIQKSVVGRLAWSTRFFYYTLFQTIFIFFIG